MKNAKVNGYTLVEMLVALSVTSIVISGAYAAYSIFSQQQQIIIQQTEMDRNALNAIQLIKSDIQMAGYKDYKLGQYMVPEWAIQTSLTNRSVINLVFDDYESNEQESIYRAFISYYLDPVQPTQLRRYWGKCSLPGITCEASNKSNFEMMADEILIDGVTNFTVETILTKNGGAFNGQPQIVKVKLDLVGNKVVDGINKVVQSNYTFLARLKNVSLVTTD